MLKIHHLRNATFVIEAGNNFILVDPMLGGKGFMPAFSFFRFKAKRNPTVDLPTNYEAILDKVTHCLITHLHPDHIDSAGRKFLVKNNIPVIQANRPLSTRLLGAAKSPNVLASIASHTDHPLH